jgi:hypothetical protein
VTIMRLCNLKFMFAFLVAVVFLLCTLSFWIYEPMCGKSPRQIALSLLDYHNITATNGLGRLGTELPGSLMLYNENWNNCHDSGPDFAEVGYDYDRLGIYFERYFELRRDLPDGHTWTLTCNVRAFFPMVGQRWWTQRLITIDDRTSSVLPYGGQSNSIPSDAVIRKSLPGIWHMTVFAADNGWNAYLNLGTNGEYSATSFFVDTEEGGKEFGRVQISNGIFIVTATNRTPDPRFPAASKPPYTALRQRIIYADDRKILISCDPLNDKMLLEKKENETSFERSAEHLKLQN